MIADRADVAPFRMGLSFDPSLPGANALRLEIDDMRDFDEARSPAGRLFVWGSPALDGGLVGAARLLERVERDGLEAVAQVLDCGFLIVHHDTEANRLSLVSDRWSSLPLFHCRDGNRFLADTCFKTLFDRRRATGAALDPWTVAEFFYFRRVFGTRTLDPGIEFLPYASILRVDGAVGTQTGRYWRIGANKLSLGEDALAERLAAAIRDSMAVHMSDGRRFGLMLSGGLDARALLAAAPAPMVCFTTAPRANNELDVARELAGLAGCPHFFIERPPTLPDDVVETSVALSGGMTVYHEAQFLDYGPHIVPHADTIFLGLAMDVMFCGHYLPKSLVRIAGRNGWHFRLHDLPAELETGFLDTVSYRLKSSDPWRLIRPELRRELRQQLHDRVALEMAEGRGLGLEGYDLWEFMHLHNFARHYSLLMAQSVRTFAACRLPAFTRELYDICWGMQAEDKANWRVYQKAIMRLSPAMMRVRNANTNIRADRSLQAQTWVKFARSLARRLPFANVRATPSWWDRSWPLPRRQLEANPRLLAQAAGLGHSDVLAAVGLFDMDAVAATIDEHLAGRADHTVMINLLQTVDGALQMGEV